MKRKNVKIITFASLALIVVLIAFFAFTGKKEVEVATKNVAEGNLEITVMATGYIQPVEEVEVGTQVSGVIEKIYVDYNSHVTKGQLLAELDKSTLQEKLNQAKSSVASAQSEYEYAQLNYTRVKRLHDSKAATDVDLETAQNQLTQAKTSLDRSKADLNQSQVNLSYAYIYSPIDGVILERAVNTGQTVAASFNTPTLFTIAEDLTKMQVEADVDEADIGQIKLGQAVSFTVDAYYGNTFNGTVSQIRLQPTVTNNVVTYTVIIDAPNPEEKLFPGMTASITITVESDKGLLVPVEAVNFKMTDDIADRLNVDTENQSSVKGQQVWVKSGERFEQRTIQTGTNDGINLIAYSGVSAGDEVILSASLVRKSKQSQPTSIMPKPPGGGGGGGPRP